MNPLIIQSPKGGAVTNTHIARQVLDAADFLEVTNNFRSQEPYSTQVIGSTASAVVAGTANYESRKWWVVEFEGNVVGIAMHTSPFNIFVSPMPTEAISVLAELILKEDSGFPGINAPNEIAERFVDRLHELSPKPLKAELYQEHLSYLLEELKMPDRIVGTMRPAEEKDFNLLLIWFQAFADEAGVESNDLDVIIRRMIDAKRLHLWMDQGRIVSMAGGSKGLPFPGGTLCRVGPVYTPPEFRKRGYASFVTANVCKLLIDEGHSVMLYADAKNQDSNGIYTKIGFNLVGSNSIWKTSWTDLR